MITVPLLYLLVGALACAIAGFALAIGLITLVSLENDRATLGKI